MDEKTVIETLKKLREESKERKFKQSVELIVNLKDLNLKNPDEQVEFEIEVEQESDGDMSLEIEVEWSENSREDIEIK